MFDAPCVAGDCEWVVGWRGERTLVIGTLDMIFNALGVEGDCKWRVR